MEYASMHHPNMVRDVVAGLQGLRIHTNIMEAVSTTVETQIIAAKEDEVHSVEEIGKADVVDVSTGI